MSVTAASVVRKASILLGDQSLIQWGADELVLWLNDGQREIVTYRPDANLKVFNATLSQGTRQDLSTLSGVSSTSPVKLVDITRNVSTASDGRVVRMIARDVLDAHDPTWHMTAASNTIKNFMFDPRNPRGFFVYPPASTNAQLEIMYSAAPTEVALPASGSDSTAVVGNIGVLDIYANSLLDYVLYRAYAKDSEYAGNIQRAAAYYSAFTNAISAELKGTAADAPQPKTT
jgi:hypothetical protein